MRQSNTLFIGMDLHRDSIEITLAKDGIGGEIRHFGAIGGTRDAFKKARRKLVAKNRSLHFCYKAEPCRYELYRLIVA